MNEVKTDPMGIQDAFKAQAEALAKAKADGTLTQEGVEGAESAPKS